MSSIDIPTDVAFAKDYRYGDSLCFRHAVLAITKGGPGTIVAFLNDYPAPCVECEREAAV